MATNHIERSYRLAPMQQGMLFHCLSAPNDGMYIVQTVCEMPPALDVSAFKKAWQSVIDRHDVLRTAFLWIGVSDPLQRVCEDVSVEIDCRDWTNVTAAEQDDLLKAFLLCDKKRGFDLSTAPLMRFALLKVASDRWLFVWTFHHMLLDGRSRTKLMKEVSLFYEAYCSNQNLELSSPPAYADYINWFYRQDRSDAEKYWQELLGAFTTPLKMDLPGKANEGRSEDRYKTLQLDLSTEVKDSLQRLARSHKVTVNLIVQALWAVLLARYCDQEDVVFGETRACRRPDFEKAGSVIGLLINTVPIRLQVTGSKPFLELLKELRAQHVALRAYESTPLAHIRDASSIDRTVELFQSIVVFEEYYPGSALQRDGCALWQGNLSRFCSINYPLTLVGYLKPDLLLQIDYDRWAYGETEMERFAEHLTLLFEEVVRDPSSRIADFRFLTNAEKQELRQWNRTETDYPEHSCLHQLFEAQVEQRPDAVAVVFEDEVLSYGELNRRANQLGHYLRELGVGPDARVAICVERSLEMIIGLLAVLKAGGAYVPLDPAYPQERLQYMLADSAPLVLLTQAHLQEVFAADSTEPRVLELDGAASPWSNQPETNPLPAAIGLTSQHLAYVIYTSGSTGTPKGVAVQHRNLVNLVCWHCTAFDMKPGVSASCVAGFGFDAATWEIWPALCGGAPVMLPLPLVARDPEALLAWWSERGPEISFLPTPVAELAFLQGVSNPQQRTLLVGGDHLRRLPAQAQSYSLVNNYGPTETTVVATSGDVELPAATATIGRPIANTHLYILDRQGELAPVGVAGELYIGGDGLARGYLSQPGLTGERFIANPFACEAGGRMYRTGDLVRWLADGRVEFRGRVDHQVKVRGYRIELGEIEARLVEHEAVREAVVLARAEDGGEDKRLVAYYTSVAGRTGAGSAAELRQHLAARLPEYMIPAAYVHLEQLPLTLNGKLDRKALPAPAGEAYAVRGYEEPVGEIETALASIWAELLKLEQVGRYDKFFDLGGHSLLAMRVVSQLREALGVEVAVSELFAHPVLADFARLIESAAQVSLPAISRCERGGPLPLSFAQQRLWLLAQLGAGHAYHIFYGWRLQGQLDRVALRKALDRIVTRHETLRTTFVSVEGEPRQQIAAAADSFFHLVEQDLSAQRPEVLDQLVGEEAAGAFDLALGPLIRGRLLRLNEDEHALLLTMHHIVSDGWSESILMKELSVLYAAFRDGEGDPLPELEVQYADYAVWQRQWLAGEALRPQTEYWQQQLAGAPALLELAADHARPSEQDYRGGWVAVELEAGLTQRLKQLSKRYGVTLYMTLLAGWAALLGRLSGQAEVVIGTPVANRSRAAVEELIGFFVNTLALRLDLSGSPTGGQLLERVKAQTVAAQQHQEVPFEQVVEAVQPLRSLSQGPLFQVMFAWQNAPQGELKLSGLEAQALAGAPSVAKFDLTLTLREAGPAIVGGLEYARSLYEAETIQRYVEFYRRLLEGIVADESRRVDSLPLLGEAEREQVLVDWNATAAEYERERCVQELIEAQVEQRPDAVAVVFEDEVLSYGELNRRANQLGHYLRELGVGPDARVAICVERSLEMIIGLLAVLKAGGAYVPLDPAYPQERLQYMLADGAPVLLLTQTHLRSLCSEISQGLPVLELNAVAPSWSNHPETNPLPATVGLTSQHLAYIIYTSGSTGTPKAVALQHRGLVNLVYWQFTAFDMKPGVRASCVAGFGFDAVTWELWPALCGGATVMLPLSMVARDPEALLAWWSERGPEISFLPTAIAELAFTQGVSNPQQRLLLLGGDHLRRLPAQAQSYSLINNYGPAETTVCATSGKVELPAAAATIGRPIANTQIYILDRQGEPAPIGVPGELYIGGAALARGYLNRGDLTAERFVSDPFAKVAGARMYQTGDLVRWLADGQLEFLGRVDHQVKVRGYRIELGEIEARLVEHEAVREAVVIAREEQGAEHKRLVAYYTSVAGKIGAAELKQHLATWLPEHMVPAAYVHLDQLPLTLNGKLNRKALPAPDGEAYAVRDYEEPVGEIETTIAEIWMDVLKLDRVGRHDNFFELGGHSLLAARVVNRFRTMLSIEFSVRTLFEGPTVYEIAERLKHAAPATMPLRPSITSVTFNSYPTLSTQEI